ncbi:unnamed protein product [Albugo candida]|uniref:Presenilin n=1 Tax=Albugo candida TaxID=65357 RepID=A0A024GFH0_9STRA|nr:unnamed protein product [Albugo candida]|eukprot:CCI45496.1 unnamed protein product [Albugo candida]
MSSCFGCKQNANEKSEDQRRLLEHQYGDSDREYEVPKSHLEEVATYEDFQHAVGSFYAVVAPVTLTMLLASLFSIEIADPTTAQEVANTYLVYKPQKASAQTNGMKMEEAMVNAIVIVSFFLVATFVIMAWQFGQLPEWTTWALVTVLAFYDLCAVLTPYGPLRCLVNLVQEEGRPLPGLLYEADVGHSSLGTNGILESELHTAAQEANSPETKAINRNSYYQCDNKHTILTVRRERSDDAEERMKKRLVSFFKRVDPASLRNVDALVWKYRGRETDLWKELTKRYLMEEEESNTIKLGLGDFVFYSVLVSRAARYDLCAMIGCICAILVGLGGTLYLLGLYKKALPALPISILLAVGVYFWVRLAYIPYANLLLSAGVFG